MLSAMKLKNCRMDADMSVASLAEAIVSRTVSANRAKSTIKNWERGLYKPRPKSAEINKLASALNVERNEIVEWDAHHKFVPMAPRKVRLVADLIRGRRIQDALDVLKFANKRAAVYVDKVLRSAIASADEQEADIEHLYVSEARVDEGGIRRGTKRWRAKDRGRAVSLTKLASHIHIKVDLE